MHRLLGTAGENPDLFERALLDEVRTDAVEGDRRPQAAVLEGGTFRHPDKKPADRFQREGPCLILGINRLDKETIVVVFHGAANLTDAVIFK